MIKILSKRIILFLCMTILVFGVFIATPIQACACGMLVPRPDKDIAMKGERGIVIFDSMTKTEQMVVDFQLSGSSDDSALIVPTPVKSEIGQVKKYVFDYFEELVSPVMDDALRAASLNTIGSVEVLERKTVGSFEIAVLKTNSYQDLFDWTNENGFKLQAEAENPVRTFIEKDFVLNVIKLKKDAAESDINPLVFTFDTDKLFYPLMEIDDSRNDFKDKSLSLFILSDEKLDMPYAEIENNELEKSDLVDGIAETDDPDFTNLKFSNSKYYFTYINSKNYSADYILVSDLGNPEAQEYEPLGLDYSGIEIQDETALSAWGYAGIAANIILISGSVVFVMINRRKLSI